MTSEERKLPFSQAIRLLTTGLEWEAGLFWEAYREFSTRYGKESAKLIMAKMLYHVGCRLGEEARDLVDDTGPIGMAKAWDIIYESGTEEAEVLDNNRFIIRSQGCAVYELFKRWEIPEEEIQFFSDAFCIADVGHATGFGKDKLHFRHTKRLMCGDDCCEWDYSTQPLELSANSIPEVFLQKVLQEIK